MKNIFTLYFFFKFNEKLHENIMLNNGLSKTLFSIFFIIYQSAIINCIMVWNKKSGL